MINTLSSFFPVVTNGTVVVLFVPVGPVFRCFDSDDDAGGDDGDVIFSFLISARLFRILAFGALFDESRGTPVVTVLVGFRVELELEEDGAACFSYLANNCSTVASSSEILATK